MRSGLAAHVSSLSDPSSGSGPAGFALRVSEDFPVFLITLSPHPSRRQPGAFSSVSTIPKCWQSFPGRFFCLQVLGVSGFDGAGGKEM